MTQSYRSTHHFKARVAHTLQIMKPQVRHRHIFHMTNFKSKPSVYYFLSGLLTKKITYPESAFNFWHFGTKFHFWWTSPLSVIRPFGQHSHWPLTCNNMKKKIFTTITSTKLFSIFGYFIQQSLALRYCTFQVLTSSGKVNMKYIFPSFTRLFGNNVLLYLSWVHFKANLSMCFCLLWDKVSSWKCDKADL